MSANLRSAFLTGSGILLDITTSVTVADTRVRAIHATGSGVYQVVGTSTTPLGSIAGNIIKFGVSGSTDIYLSDIGVRMDGNITVSAPASASTITVFYG